MLTYALCVHTNTGGHAATYGGASSQHTSAYVSTRQDTSHIPGAMRPHTEVPVVSIRQDTSGYVRIRHIPGAMRPPSEAPVCSIRQHAQAYVSIRQRTSHIPGAMRPPTEAPVRSSERRSTSSTCIRIRQHTHTSAYAYVSIRQHTHTSGMQL